MCPGRDAPALACSWDEGRKGVFRGTVPAGPAARAGYRGCRARLCPCLCRGQPPPPRGAPGVPACPGDALLVWEGVIALPTPIHFAPRSAYLWVSVRPGLPGCVFPQLGEMWGHCFVAHAAVMGVGPDPNIWICVILSRARQQLAAEPVSPSPLALLGWVMVPSWYAAGSCCFLAVCPFLGEQDCPLCQVPWLIPAFACMVLPAHGSCSAGGGG